MNTGITKINNSIYKISYILYRKRKCIFADTYDKSVIIKNQIEQTKQNLKYIIYELHSHLNKMKNDKGNYYFLLNDKEIIIDHDMYYNMCKYSWHICKGYVRCNKFELSRFIMECNDDNLIIDHINGNKLDNRRCNLRCMTSEQNLMNTSSSINSTSKYIGVSWDKKLTKWVSHITVSGTNKTLGYFNSESYAALSRDYATKKYFGEYGKLNFPERPGWQEYFMNLAEAVKLRSLDHYKVGAVLVSINDNRIIATGYNSLAPRLNDDIDWSNRSFINDTVIHAEMNVLLYSQSKFEDSILYTTTSPCKDCLKLLSAAKIKKIIYKHEYRDIKTVKNLANFLGIELIEYINIR